MPTSRRNSEETPDGVRGYQVSALDQTEPGGFAPGKLPQSLQSLVQHAALLLRLDDALGQEREAQSTAGHARALPGIRRAAC